MGDNPAMRVDATIQHGLTLLDSDMESSICTRSLFNPDFSVWCRPGGAARYRAHVPSVSGNNGVIQSVMGQTRVALDAGVPERCVFVAAERENRLVHVLGVEHLEPHE